MPGKYSTIANKKYLDAAGLTYFAEKLNNYPTNDVIAAVIDGVQDALDEKVDTSKVGTANGVASLDSSGKVPAAQLPATGTVTKVSTGAGLTGGDITGSGTVKANLTSETKLTNAAADGTETAGRVYPVRLDKNGKLAVNVPWSDSTPVTSVNGKTGAVSLTASDVGAAASGHQHTKSEITDFPTLGAAAAKAVDATISAASTSTNLPTSAAVAAFVEGKGYKTTDNDTKNTAGSTDSSAKLFLIGATSQAANPQTYSHDTAYIGTDGCLYSGGAKVLTAHQDISGKADKSATVSAVAYDSTNKKLTKTINGTTTDIVTVATLKSAMALNNVENKSSATIRGELTSSNVTTALGFTPMNAALKGTGGGVAELDANGKVLASQLPSFVDDVLDYDTLSDFPATGETGKIYVADDTNKTYRWSGTAYVEISASLALGETSSTAYRGDRGKTAYDHASAKGSAFESGLYKITTNAQGHVTAATAVVKADITALGIPGSDTNTHRPIQLNGTQILGDNTTALNLKAGSNVSITNSNGTVTIAATDTTYSSKSAASGGTDVSLVTTGEKYIWNSKTSNTGTVTSVATGVGLTGGTITGSGTIKAKLKSETASTLDSAAMGSTANRQYAVGVDKSGYLSVNVPWTDNNTNTTYTLTQDSSDGHKLTFTGSDGTSETFTIPDNNTTYTLSSLGIGNVKNYDQSKAIKAITRSGTTFTYTCLDGTTGTFTQQDNNTWTAMVGATSSANGTAGYVPAPPKDGYNTKYLRADGTWTVPPDTNTWRPVSDSVSSTSSSDAASSKAVKTAYDLAASKTANTGTVTSVATGVGLTGGTITGSGTIKAKLKSETAATYDSATPTNTANRQYPVVQDKSGYLSVNVPWSDSTPVTSVNGKTGAVSLAASDVGAATSGHTHALSMAASSGTNALTLAASTKYQLTAGGSTFIFTTPPNTTYSAITNADIDALFA